MAEETISRAGKSNSYAPLHFFRINMVIEMTAGERQYAAEALQGRELLVWPHLRDSSISPSIFSGLDSSSRNHLQDITYAGSDDTVTFSGRVSGGFPPSQEYLTLNPLHRHPKRAVADGKERNPCLRCSKIMKRKVRIPAKCRRGGTKSL